MSLLPNTEDVCAAARSILIISDPRIIADFSPRFHNAVHYRVGTRGASRLLRSIVPQPDIDPWTPDLEAFLDTLTPEAELVYRLTLQGEYPRLRGRLDWCERTQALMNEILTTQKAWDRVLAKVRAKAVELFTGTTARSSAPPGRSRRVNRSKGRRGDGRGRGP